MGGADPVDSIDHAQVTLTAADLHADQDLAPLVKKGALAVVGAYYSLDTGKVEVLAGAPTWPVRAAGGGHGPHDRVSLIGHRRAARLTHRKERGTRWWSR